MIIDNYFIYVVSAIVATVSPGPAVILIMTNSFKYGIKESLISILGNVSALFILSLISISGVSLIITTSTLVFNTLKIVGGLYLMYLGYKVIKNNNKLIIPSSSKVKNKVKKFILFKEAFLVAMSNPKALVFLMALFPNFINPEKEFIPQFSILISTLIVFSFSFLTMYAILAKKLKYYLTKDNYIQYYYKLSGTIFIIFGIFIIATGSMV